MSNETKRDQADVQDELYRALAQAEAMADHTYGNSGEAFREMSGNGQDEYLWALADKITEARNLALELSGLERPTA